MVNSLQSGKSNRLTCRVKTINSSLLRNAASREPGQVMAIEDLISAGEPDMTTT